MKYSILRKRESNWILHEFKCLHGLTLGVAPMLKTVYKIDLQKSVAFMYSNNEQVEKEYRETIPFIIVSKKIKYLGINVRNDVYDLYKNYKPMLMG
jgi:hypothetical protein